MATADAAAHAPAASAAPPAGGRARVYQQRFVAPVAWAAFSGRALSGDYSRHVTARELLRTCVNVGASSAGVVAVTGAFLGMVLAVQSYSQLHQIGLDTSLGAIINMSIVRELGPVL